MHRRSFLRSVSRDTVRVFVSENRVSTQGLLVVSPAAIEQRDNARAPPSPPRLQTRQRHHRCRSRCAGPAWPRFDIVASKPFPAGSQTGSQRPRSSANADGRVHDDGRRVARPYGPRAGHATLTTACRNLRTCAARCKSLVARDARDRNETCQISEFPTERVTVIETPFSAWEADQQG